MTVHPVVAKDPDFVRLSEQAELAQADYDASMARNETLRAAWQREMESAVLDGREVPPAPALADESGLRQALRARQERVKRDRAEVIRQRGEELAGRLFAREREILLDAARVVPGLRRHTEEIRSLLQTLHQVSPDTAGLPLPRLIDIDELLHVAAANADEDRSLSFLRGYSMHGSASVG